MFTDGVFKIALTVDFLAIALGRATSGPWRVATRDLCSKHIERAERSYAIHKLSWKVTEWEDGAGGKRWHWPQSSQLYGKGLIAL